MSNPDYNIDAGIPLYRRKRRASGLGSSVIKLLMFFCTLIPTIIIAWRIDLVNPRQQTVVVKQPQQIAQLPQPVQQVRPLAQRVARSQVHRPEPPVPKINHAPLVIKPIPKRPEKPVEPAPTQTIVIDLDSKIQREPIAITGVLKIARMEGCRHTIKPTNGLLIDSPVEIIVDGPRPVVFTFELNDRGILEIEPTVKNDAGKSVPFNTKSLALVTRRATRSAQGAAEELAGMKNERARLKAWLDSSVLKPLPDYRAGTARVKQLDVLIPEASPVVATL